MTPVVRSPGASLHVDPAASMPVALGLREPAPALQFNDMHVDMPRPARTLASPRQPFAARCCSSVSTLAPSAALHPSFKAHAGPIERAHHGWRRPGPLACSPSETDVSQSEVASMPGIPLRGLRQRPDQVRPDQTRSDQTPQPVATRYTRPKPPHTHSRRAGTGCSSSSSDAAPALHRPSPSRGDSQTTSTRRPCWKPSGRADRPLPRAPPRRLCCFPSIPHISWLKRRLQQCRVCTLLPERRKIDLPGQAVRPRVPEMPAARACLLHGCAHCSPSLE